MNFNESFTKYFIELLPKGKDIYHHVYIVDTNKVQHIEKRII